MIRLWRKNSLGIGTWRIWAEGNQIFYAHSSVEHGSEIVHRDVAVQNQSGRTLEQQVELEINSRVNRQLDKGYKRTREEALKGSTNQLGLINPMLAQPLERIKLPTEFIGYVQRKYDGHRCLITRQGDDVIAYSRRGKLIETIPEILADVSNWLPDGMTMDGELYVHGMQLQQISSIIKRIQPDNTKLKYHWYDICTNDGFTDRFAQMTDLSKQVKCERIELVPTHIVNTLEYAYDYFRQFRAEGYEGAMLRRSLRGYEDAKRSDQLVKIKERADTEVTVLSVQPSKDGWGICHVRTDWGVEFDVSAPGSVAEKTDVLRRQSDFIGKRLTIEYAGLTAENIPFHAVAIRWREDV